MANILEVCVDNIESAKTAQRNGNVFIRTTNLPETGAIKLYDAIRTRADRLEVCWDLSVGGLTPTAGFVKVMRELSSVPIFVLIRPRAGCFCYNDYEVDQMVEDIRILKSYHVDGFVFGALTRDKKVDIRVCQRLLAAALPLTSTFHRAFDHVKDKVSSLETLIDLGFIRVLTSGGSGSAFDGIQVLKKLVSQARQRIVIIPGGNINDENISAIMSGTKAKEFHSSGRKIKPQSRVKSRCCTARIIYAMCSILNPTVIPRNRLM